MEMGNSDKEVEDKVLELGNRLQKAPRSVEEILPIIDELEFLLTRVEQSPSQSMLTALNPAIMGLVSKDLLAITDTNVSIGITTCISEITRITAPDAPYDDDAMKEIFHRIVQSFGNLDDVSSTLHAKRVSILETVAKVRSCVVMLDLECDSLILKMFHHFLNTIRDSHSENVISSMKTIMDLVLEESEEISPDIIALLLLNVKTDNKDVLPAARSLAERVITTCASKLKPCLMEAVESVGAPLTDYSKIIATVCRESTDALKNLNSAKVSNEAVETTVSGETQQIPNKSQDVSENLPAPLASNGAVQPGEDSSSEKKSRHSRRSKQATEEIDNLPNRQAKKGKGRQSIKDDEIRSPMSRQGRGRGASQAQEPEQIPKEELEIEKAEKTADNTLSAESAHPKRGRSSGSRSSIKKQGSEPSANGKPVEKISEDSDELEKKPLKDLAKRLLGEGDNKSGTSRKVRSKIVEESVDEDSVVNTLKTRGRKPNKPMEEGLEKPATSDASNLGGSAIEPKTAAKVEKKESASVENSQKKRPKKQASDEGTAIEPKTAAKVEKKESASVENSQKKRQKKQASDEGTAIEPKTAAKVEKKETASVENSQKKRQKKQASDEGTAIEPKTAAKVEKDTAPGESSQKKRQKEQASDEGAKTVHEIKYDEHLVGVKIKVWWPDDKKFYAGVVKSYNPTTMKHKILYDDGDEENLLLKKETIKFRKGTKLGVGEKTTSTSDGTPETEKKKSSEPSGKRPKSTTSPSDHPREVDGVGSTAGSGKKRGRQQKPLEGDSGSRSKSQEKEKKKGEDSATRSSGIGQQKGRRPKDVATGDNGSADGDRSQKRKAGDKERRGVDKGSALASGGTGDGAKRRKK